MSVIGFCLQLKWVYEVHKNREELLEKIFFIKSLNFDLGAVLGELLKLLLVMWSCEYQRYIIMYQPVHLKA
jgi:hypothetical protein